MGKTLKGRTHKATTVDKGEIMKVLNYEIIKGEAGYKGTKTQSLKEWQ